MYSYPSLCCVCNPPKKKEKKKTYFIFHPLKLLIFFFSFCGRGTTWTCYYSSLSSLVHDKSFGVLLCFQGKNGRERKDGYFEKTSDSEKSINILKLIEKLVKKFFFSLNCRQSRDQQSFWNCDQKNWILTKKFVIYYLFVSYLLSVTWAMRNDRWWRRSDNSSRRSSHIHAAVDSWHFFVSYVFVSVCMFSLLSILLIFINIYLRFLGSWTVCACRSNSISVGVVMLNIHKSESSSPRSLNVELCYRDMIEIRTQRKKGGKILDSLQMPQTVIDATTTRGTCPIIFSIYRIVEQLGNQLCT